MFGLVLCNKGRTNKSLILLWVLPAALVLVYITLAPHMAQVLFPFEVGEALTERTTEAAPMPWLHVFLAHDRYQNHVRLLLLIFGPSLGVVAFWNVEFPLRLH